MEPKVLLISNDPLSAERILSALRSSGLEIERAAKDIEGLLEQESNLPAVIIIDDNPPRMDGWEACAQIYSLMDNPIILLGEEPKHHVYPQAVEAGAAFYLEKPFSPAELIARVRALLWRLRAPPDNKGSPEETLLGGGKGGEGMMED